MRERERTLPKLNPPTLIEICLLQISQNAVLASMTSKKSSNADAYSYLSLQSRVPRHLTARLGQHFSTHAQTVVSRKRLEERSNPKAHKTKSFYSDLKKMAWQVSDSTVCIKGNKLGKEEAQVITYCFSTANHVNDLDLQWNELRVRFFYPFHSVATF
jgi:hypothetical protein